MKKLISGQTIKCDIHDAGSTQPVEWGKGLHIHKRMQGRDYGVAEIRIPLDSDKDIEIDTRGSKETKVRLFNEIREAFSDVQKIREFIKGLIHEIERFSNGVDVEEHYRAAARRIAKHFELEEKIAREIIEKVDSKIARYTSVHSGGDSKLYYITQSPGEIIASEFRPRSRIIRNK